MRCLQVIAVLNKETESDTEDDDDSDSDSEVEINPDKLTLDRLKLALKYEQKQVKTTHRQIYTTSHTSHHLMTYQQI